jgi:haloacetate dehalogenase
MSDSNSRDIGRRDLLRQTAGVIVASAIARFGEARQQGIPLPAGSTLRFFPGFKPLQIQTTTGVTINGVIGGQGPPVLLLHGAPQSHISWRLVAPQLATEYTVVVPDLRGYGDSSKPPDGENHANYSKRAMALDQVEVMRQFGFERFSVIGHDRGGRVAHRMALDHPDRVVKIAVLDIVPTYYLYTHVTIGFVQAYYHWFSYLRPAPIPENELKGQIEAAAPGMTSDVQQEYLRIRRNPENIHGMCEDYRAGASIDLDHDKADLDKKIHVPLLALWAGRGAMARLFDILLIWKDRGAKVSGKGLPGGHNLQEDVPTEVLAELRPFLRSA